MTETLAEALVVLHPFRSYRKGDIITDAAMIAAVKASVSPANYVPTSIPVAPTSPEKHA